MYSTVVYLKMQNANTLWLPSLINGRIRVNESKSYFSVNSDMVKNPFIKQLFIVMLDWFLLQFTVV